MTKVSDMEDATPLVAANDASSESKARAAYVSNGIADDIEIQAAIKELPGGGLAMLRDKFQGKQWFSEATAYWASGFRPLVERLLEASRWVTFHRDNRDTDSVGLASVLKDAGGVFDSTLRALVKGAGIPPRGRDHDIVDFCNFLQREVPDIARRSVAIRTCLPAGVVVPLEELEAEGDVPAWWTAYNKVKHEGSVAYRLGNLENAVTAVCALALLGKLMSSSLPRLFVNAGIAYPEGSVDMSDERRLFPRRQG